jgi:glycosyltransferase involved in cell wall biosynthesis
MTLPCPSILLIGGTLSVGGTERQFVEVASRLDRSRWDVHVSCVRAEGPLRKTLEASGIEVSSHGRGSFKSPSFVASLWELAAHLRRCRIRLVHSFDFYSNVIGGLAARLARVPVVIASQRDLGDLRPRFDRRVQYAMLRMADRILVNSDAVAERLQRHRALVDRIVVIGNGVDLARFAPAEDRAGRRAGQITVGTLANLRPEKGLADFVRAAALVRDRCPNVRFVVWGDGPERRHLEHLVRQLGLHGVVELPGLTATPEEELRRLDVFVLPSISEACSNGLLEAMATGVPVVTTKVGGNARLVEDGITGLLVPAGEPRPLANAIIRLIGEPAFASALAARGRDRLRDTFAVDRMVAQVEGLYERTLTGDGSSSRPGYLETKGIR